MVTWSSDLRIKTPRIRQDENFCPRRLSREMSASNSSVEVYYGGSSVAIPFTWESQPGTPKVRFHETPLPPLTPPPSFHSSPTRKPIKKQSNSGLLHTVLPKLSQRKSYAPPSPVSSAWSSSNSVPSSPFTPKSRGQFRTSSPRSSRSVPSSPLTPSLREQLRASSPRSSSDLEPDEGSPVSTLCFGISRGANARSRGSSSIMMILLGEFV